ncbi:MAG: hypothetical protein KJ062_04375 [Thermoanaerobaculia bacterium]|nr:hypothetical protein [Thermoanaerobaculia bacterium]
MSGGYPFPVKSLDEPRSGQPGFRWHDETGPAGRRYHFGLPLPEKWDRLGEAGKAPSREEPLTFLARYRPTEGPEAEIVVTGRLLERDVAPADLLLPDLERSGEEILHRREIDSPDGRSIDVLTRRRTERGRLVLRRSTEKRGSRMLVLHAAATEETYDQWADRLSVVAAGLRFLEPGTWHCAEALGTLARKSPSDFLLFYPDSWQVDGPDAGPDVFSASLVSRLQDRVAGRIDLAVVSRAARPDLRPVVDGFLAGLTAAGFEGPPIPFAPIRPPAAFNVAWEGVGERTSGNARVELRLRIGQRPDAWFCFALAGPTRQSAPDVWAVNRRALELAFDLVATPDVPVQGWIARAIETSRRPPSQASPRSSPGRVSGASLR